MFERFTHRARHVMVIANQRAQQFGHKLIGTEHIFLGLMKEDAGTGAKILKERGVDIEKMVGEIEQLIKLKEQPEPAAENKIPGTPSAIKVVEYAVEEARSLNHDHIGTEHLLLGLMRETDGIVAQVLTNLGIKLEDVRENLSK
jgi:ATP-dependent Clp protease ATP-binding subunit ClpC